MKKKVVREMKDEREAMRPRREIVKEYSHF